MNLCRVTASLLALALHLLPALSSTRCACCARCACRYYSLFTLMMLVMFECTVVGQRLRNLHDVRALQQPKQASRRWQRPGRAALFLVHSYQILLCI